MKSRKFGYTAITAIIVILTAILGTQTNFNTNELDTFYPSTIQEVKA